jgi:DnaJ domain
MRYPLTWPTDRPRTPAAKRKKALFKHKGGNVTVAEAIKRLMHEISSFTPVGQSWVIDPEMVIVSSNLLTRNDGLPRSGQKEPEDPGIAIYFQMRERNYCFACDVWDRTADNIVAIAKHLEAIRGQERWGVGSIDQAFQGYMALPDQVSRWWLVLGVKPDASQEEIQKAYRRLALESHPDAGGQREDWERIAKAYEQAKSNNNHRVPH